MRSSGAVTHPVPVAVEGQVVRHPGTRSFQHIIQAILGGGGAKPGPQHQTEGAGCGSGPSNGTR